MKSIVPKDDKVPVGLWFGYAHRPEPTKKRPRFFARGDIFYFGGFSIIELLIVISVFSILAIVSTQIVIISLRNSGKGKAVVNVRENTSFVLSLMERRLRSAKGIDCTSTNILLKYIDENGIQSSYACIGGINGHLEENGVAITNTSEIIIDCTSAPPFVFSCTTNPFVEVSLSVRDAVGTGVESVQTQVSSKIFIRSL